MAKKITLFSYSKKKKQKSDEVDKKVIRFLKAQSEKGRLLIISDAPEAKDAQKLGFEVTVVDSDLNTVKEGRQKNKKINYEYSDFLSFARRIRKDEFDIVYDNAFSNSLLRNQNSNFYKDVSKILKFNGTLITKLLTTNDPYCKEHCPIRNWTYIGDYHINYFTKNQILKLLKLHGFNVNKYSVIKNKNTYHLLNSTLKTMKL